MQTTISITAISISLVYILYLLFRKGRSAIPFPLALVIISSTLLEVFDLSAFLYPGNLFFWKKITLITESLLPSIWLWFTLTYARQNDVNSIPTWQRFLLATSPLFFVGVIILPINDFFYSPDLYTEKILFLGKAGYVFYSSLLVFLIIPLINLEVTLISATHLARWKIKFELLGSGLLLAVMIFYYSHALLYNAINMNLVPARTVLLIVALLMMAYSRLLRGNGVKVYVSQQILCKSVVLLAVGAYLIALGLMGEGTKHFGSDFQKAMAIAISFIAGLGLLIILFSETIRRKIRIFIQKNFYRNKYDYRNQWLQFTEILSSAKTKDELLRSIVIGFCDTFGMGCGMLFLLDQEKDIYHQATEIAIEPNSVTIHAEDDVVTFIAGNRWMDGSTIAPPETGDEKQQAFFSKNDIAFAIPLFMNEQMGGIIMLGDTINKNERYGLEDFDLMRTLARQASSALLNLNLSEQLSISRELAAIGKVSTFVMHDLKNQVSALSLMLDNAKKFIDVPEFQKDMFDSLNNTVTKMNDLISRLKNLPENMSLQKTPVDLLQLAQETAHLIKGGSFQVSGDSVIADIDREEMRKVALNLMLNAVESTEGNRPVSVEVGIDDTPYIKVRDEGCGIPEDFLSNSLFTIFKSTKKKGLGIGLYQCKKIVEAHGGKIKVSSELHKGSEFTVLLPGSN